MNLFFVLVMVLFIAIHSGSSAGDSPFVENYNSTQLLLRKPINLQTPSNPQAMELGYKCAELPTGSDRFKQVVKKKCLVDKTDYLYNIVKENETQVLWFLARPRRFGKTLVIATMASFFQGETEFFVDTNMYKQHMKFDRWPNYPVIRLDFSEIKSSSISEFKERMLVLLQDEAEDHDIHLDTADISIAIRRLIRRLKRKHNKNVVLLIDEYDAPYTHMYSVNKSESPLVLAILQEFFSLLKGRVDDIRISFTTGTSRLALADFFSGANAARDISMDPDYAGIVGFNDTELTQYFGRFIEYVADRRGNTTKEILTQMRKWYDGFRFTKKNEPLYSPISVIEYLRSNGDSISSYSGTGGSSQFFQQKLKQFPLEAIEILLHYDTKDNAYQSNAKIEDDADKLEKKPEIRAKEGELSGKYTLNDITNPSALVVFLYHSGYLSISSYDNTTSCYILNITNLELRTDLAERLTYSLTDTGPGQVITFGDEMVEHLAKHEWQSFIETLEAYLSRIPYHLIVNQRKKIEALFQISMFECFRHCTSKSVPWTMPTWEYSTSRGRSDIVLTIADTVYIFELKMDDNQENALYECKEKYLPAHLRGSEENVACFGIKFSQSGKVTSFGVAIFSRTGELHTEAGEMKLPTSFTETEKKDITYQVNEFRKKHIHFTLQPDKLLEFFQQIGSEQVDTKTLVEQFTDDKQTFILFLDQIRKALPKSYDNLKGVIFRVLKQCAPKTKQLPNT